MKVPDQVTAPARRETHGHSRQVRTKLRETRTLKRKWLISTLAAIPAILMPLAATAQIAPDSGTRPEPAAPTYKYEIYAGYAYTSLNQVNQSRHGLQGVDINVTRDWGRYFGLTVDGAYFPSSLGSGNPGKPVVESLMGGPGLHAPIYGQVNGFLRALLGAEHTGGEGMNPKVSFAGGAGGGLEYVLSPHLVLRAEGDDIASSFTLINNTPQLGYSPHERWNARAMFGVVYRF